MFVKPLHLVTTMKVDLVLNFDGVVGFEVRLVEDIDILTLTCSS